MVSFAYSEWKASGGERTVDKFIQGCGADEVSRVGVTGLCEGCRYRDAARSGESGSGELHGRKLQASCS